MALNAAWRTVRFTILFPGTVTVAAPAAILALLRRRIDLGALRFLGLLPFLAGVAGYLLCARSFVVEGRGTPAPWDPPRALVARGLYRFVRNPMYVSLLCVVLGEALWFGAPALLAYAAALFLGFHLRVVIHEEPRLEATFGDGFRSYRARVPRWLPRPGGGPDQ